MAQSTRLVMSGACLLLTLIASSKAAYVKITMDDVVGDTLIGSIVHGTIFGDAQQSGGIVGKSLYLNGTAQYVNFGNQANWCFGNMELCDQGATYAFWMKMGINASGPMQYYLSTGGGSHTMAIGSIAEDHRAVVTVGNNTWGPVNYTFPYEKWVHIALTWSLGNGLKLYINGSLEKSSPVSSRVRYYAPLNGTNDFVMGKQNIADDYYADAWFDEFEFWDSERSAGFIRQLYSSSFAPTKSPPVSDGTSYMKITMDNVVENTLIGPMVNGTIFGHVKQSEGVVGKSLYLSGSAQYVNFGNQAHWCFGNMELCDQGVTYALWMKVSENETKPMQYYLNCGGGSHNMALASIGGDHRAVVISRKYMWGLKFSIPHEEWVHVAMTWSNSSGLKLYVNGSLAESSPAYMRMSFIYVLPGTNDFVMGTQNIEHKYSANAWFDELVFWDRERSADFIRQLYLSSYAKTSTTVVPTVSHVTSLRAGSTALLFIASVISVIVKNVI